MPICKRVVYTGRVQSVGFRFTAVEIAQRHRVAGTVRNCSDGSVELVVQGEADEVRAFLAALARQMQGYISEQRIDDAAPCSVEGFHVIR